ncbi:endo alpha-1,4 polygalactosaminidase [Neobacillus dielmonensis]|uniref:endo alpha-1,4 polygalactosaminidase n=1 Tax=Neobacillus dielmonensis TaxID=1347369 RepID=UPI0005A61786|nr:endo alpha-1,4 polygalactosaminidase [Neobacillus dielmonensis]
MKKNLTFYICTFLSLLLIAVTFNQRSTPTVNKEIWAPPSGYATQWQWQLKSMPSYISGITIYDFDGEDAAASDVKNLKDRGARTICYISAGSWEDWRSDASSFPSSVKGKKLDGWAGEKWLDIRQLSILLPIMGKRMDVCKAKGFDAVEADNVDGYANNTGFPLTSNDQLVYNKVLAQLAHDRGMSIALKNDVDQLETLEPYFDFAINEECFAYNECGKYKPFVDAGKAVLNVEYKKTSVRCSRAKSLGISSMMKKLELDEWRKPCK